MNRLLAAFARWFGAGTALESRSGQQITAPAAPAIEGTVAYNSDGALQLSAVWRCVNLIVNTISTLPLFVYANDKGQRDLARETGLWSLLHVAPNASMTVPEFWGAMVVNWLLRGNGYARIQRNAAGEAIALWPMAADQVTVTVLDDGSVVYLYKAGAETYAFPASEVLHLKGMGNGVAGLSRISYMAGTVTESVRSQSMATRLYESGNKPSGVLTIDRVLTKEQRDALRRNFAEVAEGNTARLFVLEADMKWQQVSLTPHDAELLATRQFTVEEVCRWFGVPPVLAFHNNVTTWGSGIEQILEGWYKLDVRPMLVQIEQALTRRVLTPAQRVQFTVEWSFDGLLRANLKDRAQIYATLTQNGVMTRNEARQLENMPPVEGGNQATAQTNLAPLAKLGEEPEPPPPLAEEMGKSLAPLAERFTRLEAAVLALAARPAAHHINVQPAEVNVKAGDTHVTLPEGLVQLEATVESPAVTVQPAEVKVDAPITVQPAPARPTRTVHTRDARGELLESRTTFED
jgi:HK97 family phage portal protein